MKIDLSRFRQTFFQEAAEHVNSMEALLLALTTGSSDPEALHAIFRAAHSIKGGSGTFAFDDITRFTHRLEELLDRMRQGQVEPSPARVELLLRACDVLRKLLAAADAGAAAPSETEPTMKELAVAERAGELIPGAEQNVRADDAKPPAAGQTTYAIHFSPSPAILREGMDPLLVLRELAELGTVEDVTADLRQLPDLSHLQPDICYLAWDIRLTTSKARSEIEDVFAFVEDGAQITITPVSGQSEPERPGTATTAASALPQSAVRANEQTQRHDSGSIRVGTEKIDQLINLVGELVIAQSMTLEIVHHFTPERLPELQAALKEVERNTRELQDRAMAVRMLPVATVFARLPRIVHDVAKASGKSIALETAGEETELDKSVLEALVDPLTHLIRNAADHGIESVEERRAAGKPEQGTIRVQARHQSGNFVIEISDDGHGLDLARIRAKAIDRGLITGSEDLSPEEIQSFIFQPGFSTAEVVSELSGRGVGMDVVRKNVEALGGLVTLKSVAGKGTSFSIRLPLTLAILEGQLVRVGKQTYVLPLVSIIESIRPGREHVRSLAGQGEVVMVRQDPLPLLRLHRLFSVNTDVLEPWQGIIVVIEHEGRRFALLVDDLLSQQQVVIKSLQSNFRKVEGAMGATILGDGRVTIILDVTGLVELSRKAASFGGTMPIIPVRPTSEAPAEVVEAHT